MTIPPKLPPLPPLHIHQPPPLAERREAIACAGRMIELMGGRMPNKWTNRLLRCVAVLITGDTGDLADIAMIRARLREITDQERIDFLTAIRLDRERAMADGRARIVRVLRDPTVAFVIDAQMEDTGTIRTVLDRIADKIEKMSVQP